MTAIKKEEKELVDKVADMAINMLIRGGWGNIRQAQVIILEKLKDKCIIMGDYCEPMVKLSEINRLILECGG